MNYFIEKNMLIDEILYGLNDNLPDNHNIYNILNELRNNNETNYDIILLRNVIADLDNIAYESNEYAKSIVDLEFEYNYICKYIDNLYDAKYQIINFINSINEIDVLSDLVSEFKINNN
jgi:hypothetical protein